MVAQHPPFAKPDVNDRHYNAICANREDLFWKWHTKNKKGGLDYFSECFRDLIGQMLQLDPIARPTLAEIRAHEWFNLPVPSHDEVKAEFVQRCEMLTKSSLRQGEEAPDETPDPDIFKNNITHRGIDAAEEGVVPSVAREVQEYVAEMRNCTHFFSTSNLSTLFNILAICAHKMSKEYYFSPDDYSVVMNIVHEGRRVILTGSILKVPDEDKYCVDFHRYQGDNFLFSQLYNQIIQYFGGHANALPPDGEK
jgi:serine/threonine protein kinase